MASAFEKAQQFLEHEKAFRLGQLPTETFHPKTINLSQIAADNLAEGIRQLQSVDDDMPPVADKVLGGEVFHDMVDCFVRTMQGGRRIFFTGCGATGRLSILLEAAWRKFWQGFDADMHGMEDMVYSVMAGGDFALIKSVEGFEDFMDFGRHQLKTAGVSEGDMVVAITEGGETSFVIGTAWQGLDSGAEVFFVYNNPTDALCEHVERSRLVIEEPRIRKMDLFTGPMAISGSTRMQATTIELLAVGAALEIALARFVKEPLREASEYCEIFEQILHALSQDDAIEQMAGLVRLEEEAYRQNGLVTYFTDEFMLDVLTDTTERSPTFMLPAFRRKDDSTSPRSWAFAKNPLYATQDAWRRMLRRKPRGLDWDKEVYRQLDAPGVLQDNPPLLNNDEIHKFQIGNETDSSRTDTSQSVLIPVAVGEEAGLVEAAVNQYGGRFDKTAAICFGDCAADSVDQVFRFPLWPNTGPLQLTEHLAVKLVLNTVSTMTMVRMGRVLGNAMIQVSPSNKKLIDRGCRLIRHVTGCSYEDACVALFEAIETNSPSEGEPVSPVAAAIDRLSER